MSVKLFEIIHEIERVAPPSLQESYDNSGLLVGDKQSIITQALLCLDCTEAIVDEAIAKKCNLIIAHHPLIFSGLKRLTGQNDVQRAVIKAIQNNITIYACHTNLDNVLRSGVNEKIAEKLHLSQLSVLEPKTGLLVKLGVYVPPSHFTAVQDALFTAGAGNIGNYGECGFSFEGQGTFTPMEGSNPYSGSLGKRETGDEMRLEVVFMKWQTSEMMQVLREAHPYEEVAYDLVTLNNEVVGYGSGAVGMLPKEMSKSEFLAHLKDKMELEVVKHTEFFGENIRKVAVCGGAGSFLINAAKSAQADVYITSDIKYHEFFAAEKQLMICDIGHFESEKYTIDLFSEILSKKFRNFATIFAQTNTNPIQYYR